MNPGPIRLGLLLILGVAQAAFAEDARGYGELRFSFFPGVDGDRWQLVERVRPTLQAEPSDRVKLVATIEAGLAQGRDNSRELERTLRESDFGPLLDQAECTWPQPKNRLLRIDGAADYLDVDRLFVDVYGEKFDLRVGRQALNWGSARVFNPTDPFPEVLFAEPWRPRRGVNAARVSVPFGELNDVSAVVGTNDTFDQLRAAGRVRLNWAGTDLALVGAWRGDSRSALVGLDLRGTFGVGWWLEGAYLFGDHPHEELAAGIDYSFPILERAVVFAEYYRNGAGATDPNAYQRSASLGELTGPSCATGSPLGAATERDPFAPFVVGRDYLSAGAALTVIPDLDVSVTALQNLDDGTGLVVPTVSYAVLDWLELAASGQLGYALWGEGGELKPNPEQLHLSYPSADGKPLSADFTGLVPTATVTVWTRASF